jgi:TfoX/Sxy family transcriptional regulator of competence genes
MAYDEELADRIRSLVAGEDGVTEQKMFGGLAFLLNGNMAVAASGQGGILVRVDPEESARLVETTPAEEMVMRGRSMAGWLRVESSCWWSSCCCSSAAHCSAWRSSWSGSC